MPRLICLRAAIYIWQAEGVRPRLTVETLLRRGAIQGLVKTSWSGPRPKPDLIQPKRLLAAPQRWDEECIPANWVLWQSLQVRMKVRRLAYADCRLQESSKYLKSGTWGMLPVCMPVSEAHRERYVRDAWNEVCPCAF